MRAGGIEQIGLPAAGFQGDGRVVYRRRIQAVAETAIRGQAQAALAGGTHQGGAQTVTVGIPVIGHEARVGHHQVFTQHRLIGIIHSHGCLVAAIPRQTSGEHDGHRIAGASHGACLWLLFDHQSPGYAVVVAFRYRSKNQLQRPQAAVRRYPAVAQEIRHHDGQGHVQHILLLGGKPRRVGSLQDHAVGAGVVTVWRPTDQPGGTVYGHS